ncbi:regulator of chromosome condensation 1/beta-lactamase-inhibitor protein II [Syncephalis fuscata]|nr:regulator of chromosome condensation 1/beta-lactamase-inhibitor protein II [Syncephalis fuscata]
MWRSVGRAVSSPLRGRATNSATSTSVHNASYTTQPPFQSKTSLPVGTTREVAGIVSALGLIGGAYAISEQPGLANEWIQRAAHLTGDLFEFSAKTRSIHAEGRVSGESDDTDLFAGDELVMADGVLYEDKRQLPGTHRSNISKTTIGKKGEVASSAQTYAWGSNEYRVVAPDLESSAIISAPRAIPGLDGCVWRDVALNRRHAAAIDISGDLYQWGDGFDSSNASIGPQCSLAGLSLTQVALTNTKVYGLTSDGRVIVLSAAHTQQLRDATSNQLSKGVFDPSLNRSWWPSWPSLWPSSGSNNNNKATLTKQVGYGIMQLQDANHKEKVIKLAAGGHHIVALTDQGRVFISAADAHAYPIYQYNHLFHLIVDGLEREQCADVACGQQHTMIRTVHGDVFTMGDNQWGQLGLGRFNTSRLRVLSPQKISSIQGKGASTNITRLSEGRVISIAAGGNVSYFMIERNVLNKKHETVRQLYACGAGQYGQLGTGQVNRMDQQMFTQAQGTPVKIRSLSELTEYSEKDKQMQPIGIYAMAVGDTHTALVLDTHVEDVPDNKNIMIDIVPLDEISMHANDNDDNDDNDNDNDNDNDKQPDKMDAISDSNSNQAVLTGQAVNRMQLMCQHRLKSKQHAYDTSHEQKIKDVWSCQALRAGYRASILFEQIVTK